MSMASDGPMCFSDSDNSSSVCYPDGGPSSSEPLCSPDVAALSLLSSNLESLFFSRDLDFCADAFIVVGSDSTPGSISKVPVHRCVLSSRSPFFRELFRRESQKEGKSEFRMKELVGDFEVGYDALRTMLGYIYSGRVGPLPQGVCVCADERCSHIGCRPAVDFMVQVLYASFVFEIAELASLYQRRVLDILENVVMDDILVILSVANLCKKMCGRLLIRCIEIVATSNLDVVTLEKTVSPDILKEIMDLRIDQWSNEPENIGFPDKHVKRIHRALDSDDIELVKMLLTEANATLDDACALHYAVAYCDAKMTMELLELGIADVNHRNMRGYTVLHIAALRREPNIILSLLTNGARACDLTADGRNALQIAKRLTKHADYFKATEKGVPSPKDKLCIEILEQAERKVPQPGEASVTLAMAGDDDRSKLLYLENRVGLAKLLFPMEARVAMEIAQVDGTMEFTFGNTINISAGNCRSSMDLYDSPFNTEKGLLRIEALSRTVQLAKRYFPRCSKVLDQIMDDEMVELAGIGSETSEDRLRKKQRYHELQDMFRRAFDEDQEENDRSVVSPSSVARIRTKFTRK